MNITIILSLISTTIAICIGVGGYVLKVSAERRLQDSNRAEIDVKLSTLFTELGYVAHARSKILGVEVGHASQIAAIISLEELGNRYDILYEPAKAALNSLKIWLVDFVLEETDSFKKALVKDRVEAVKKALALLERPKITPKNKKIIAREGLVFISIYILWFIFGSITGGGISDLKAFLLGCFNFTIGTYLIYGLIRFIIWALRTLKEKK
jgi:hypothetical protein